jgi:uncharacterized protein involved in outer membrane biogenesis
MTKLNPQDPASRRQSRWSLRSLLWIIPLLLVLFVVVSDLFGWAYLRRPVESFLSAKLDRKVEIAPPFSVHLRPSIPIRIGGVRVAAPEWSKQPYFADVEGIEADVGWGVLVGRQPVVHRLAVARADVHAERDKEGRASWSMGNADAPASNDSAPILPVVETLSLGKATVDVKDAINDLDVQLEAKAGGEGAGSRPGNTQDSAPDAGRSAPDAARTAPANIGLSVTGQGKWKSQPLSFDMRTKGSRAALEAGSLPDIEIRGKVAGTELSFDGAIADASRLQNVTGKVSARGPSLGELAIPGLTLPATPPYRLEGDVERAGSTIKVKVTRAEVGSSSMQAYLEYVGTGTTPMLRGTVSASRLVLQDLGPSIGTTGGGKAEGASAGQGGGKDGGKGGSKDGGKGGSKGADKGKASAAQGNAKGNAAGAKGAADAKGKTAAAGGDAPGSRVLPTKEFDLPSLRAMNADVAIDLQKLDLGTEALRPLQSLKAKLKLQDLKSDLAGGTVTGSTVLDGSSADGPPVFDAKLNWNRVNLKNWITVSADYFVAGRFSGETILKGSGKSTASILESLTGTVKGHIDGGSISHQIVELAGLDAGQALGIFFRGDKPLMLSCALVDLAADKGTLRSNLFLLNTTDTIFFVQGSVNFRNERLDMRLVQSPKDWSPLSLRSPVTIGGTLGNPAIGVEPAPIALKLIASAVLGSVTPLAALLPLIETQDNAAREGCAPAIDQVKKQAASAPGTSAAGGSSRGAASQGESSPGAAAEGTPPPNRTRDADAPVRRPGRAPGERP